MKLNISVSNFGKINNADIRIRPFTVIAGPNSSGKSFVTKGLYSFFNTINIDHVTLKTLNHVDALNDSIAYMNSLLYSSSSVSVKISLDELRERLGVIKKTIDDTFKKHTFVGQEKQAVLLKEPLAAFETSISLLRLKIAGTAKYQPLDEQLEGVQLTLNQLKEIVENPRKCFVAAIDKGFINALKENFQVSNLADLKNYRREEDLVEFNFDTLGKINLQQETLTFSLKRGSIDEFQNLYNVVYIESPVYWKMKPALEWIKKSKRATAFSRTKPTEYLTGVPQHFYDLLDLLDNQPKNSQPFMASLQTIKEAIGGNIVISPSGELSFQETGASKSISLHSTALGTTNLGLIALLLERGILARGSFLFIDEPEAHLHPSWQKIMVDRANRQ